MLGKLLLVTALLLSEGGIRLDQGRTGTVRGLDGTNQADFEVSTQPFKVLTFDTFEVTFPNGDEETWWYCEGNGYYYEHIRFVSDDDPIRFEFHGDRIRFFEDDENGGRTGYEIERQAGFIELDSEGYLE